MAFYMFEAKYGPEALAAMVKNPQDREGPARAAVESVGGKLLHLFFTMGEWDIVALIEAPDDKAMAAGSMVVGASGAMSAGRTTKLITSAEAVEAMKIAHAASANYKPATG